MLKALVISISFPYVIGTLAPTIRVTLINTISTLRITENTSLTHKDANKLIYS